MSNFSNYGGLTSQTGSVGGGGDGNNHTDNRGIFFPEFDQWANNEGAILKTSTRAKLNKDNGISETITIDVNFNDGAWRPSSTVLAYSNLPKIGSQHPTITSCTLKNVSIQSYNGQHDHFRAILDYEFEDFNINFSAGDEATPLDEPFVINWTPTIRKEPVSEDLNGTAIRNPNGEAYDASINKVRLDGVCTWNQPDWDTEDTTNWVSVINRDTWTVGEYKFEALTVLCNYVVGNLAFYTNDNGRRVPYYKMQAGISYDPFKWSFQGAGEGEVRFRREGSFYYKNTNKKIKYPRPQDKANYESYDLDSDGVLLSRNVDQPTSPNPEYDNFKLFNAKKFNFVDV